MLWAIVYDNEKWGTCLELLCRTTREDAQKLADEMNKKRNGKNYYIKKGETY